MRWARQAAAAVRLPTATDRPTLPDLIAGVTVGLVLIPQSLGYAQVAGMPPVHGLYAAALPSVAAAFLVSSRFLQTGPVGLTALLTFAGLAPLARPESSDYVALAALLAVLVGALRILVGVLRLGRFAYLISPQLLLGFVPAAAILIVASQVPDAFGSSAEGSVLGAAAGVLGDYREWDFGAVGFAAGTIALILIARGRSYGFVAVLPAVAAGVVLGHVFGYSGPEIGTIPSGVPPVSLGLPYGEVRALFLPALVIAFVGFAEPAAIARSLAAKSRERWSPNRELVSQGVAGIVSGVSGGFPVGGSFSRTNLIRLSGARTRWAGAVAGLVVLFALPFSGVVSTLPRAVIAGFVIASVAPLIRFDTLISLWRISRPQAAIATATFTSALVFAPRIDYAVMVGVVLSVLNHLAREFRLDIDSVLVGDELTLRPRGVLWFGSAQSLEDLLAGTFARHPEAKRVRIELGGLGRIDLSGAIALRTFVREARRAKLDVSIGDVPPGAARVLRAVLDDRDH